jgi:hypothetical protein
MCAERASARPAVRIGTLEFLRQLRPLVFPDRHFAVLLHYCTLSLTGTLAVPVYAAGSVRRRLAKELGVKQSDLVRLAE